MIHHSFTYDKNGVIHDYSDFATIRQVCLWTWMNLKWTHNCTLVFHCLNEIAWWIFKTIIRSRKFIDLCSYEYADLDWMLHLPRYITTRGNKKDRPPTQNNFQCRKNLKGLVYRAAKFILISLFFLFHQIYRLCCFGKVNLLQRMSNSLLSTVFILTSHYNVF